MANNLINKIKSTSIVDILKNYLALTKRGANYLAICPFHHDTKPSLTINEQKNIWKCFACGESGDAISFVAKYNQLSYYDAAIKIANDLNWDKSIINDFQRSSHYQIENEKYFKLNQKYLEYCQSFLTSNNYPNVLAYLKKRQIDPKIVKHFGIGYNPSEPKILYELLTNEEQKYINISDNELFTRDELIKDNLAFISESGKVNDVFSNRIIFSIKDEHQNIVGFSGRTIGNDEPKYLNTSSTPIFNKSNILYNINNLKLDALNKQIYIVEGFMDVIALYRAGIYNAVATMGTALTNNHIKKLKQFKDLTTIILAFDNDDAGLNAIIHAGKLIGRTFKVNVVNRYDNKYKDFDEIVSLAGNETLNELITNEIPFSLFYLETLSQQANLKTDSLKQDFLLTALDIIATYGYIDYKSNYIDLLNSITGIDKTLLQDKIIEVLKSSISHKLIENIEKISLEEDIYKNKYLSVFKKTNERLILACMGSLEATIRIKDKYNFYVVQSDDQFFIKYYNLNKRFINIIFDYYIYRKDCKQINYEWFDDFKLFINDYLKDNDRYAEIFKSYVDNNEIKYNKYVINEKNIDETLKSCYDAFLNLQLNLINDEIMQNPNSMDNKSLQDQRREISRLIRKNKEGVNNG